MDCSKTKRLFVIAKKRVQQRQEGIPRDQEVDVRERKERRRKEVCNEVEKDGRGTSGMVCLGWDQGFCLHFNRIESKEYEF